MEYLIESEEVVPTWPGDGNALLVSYYEIPNWFCRTILRSKAAYGRAFLVPQILAYPVLGTSNWYPVMPGLAFTKRERRGLDEAHREFIHSMP